MADGLQQATREECSMNFGETVSENSGEALLKTAGGVEPVNG